MQIEAAAANWIVISEFLINAHTGGVAAIEITAEGDFGVGECVASECCWVACELAVSVKGIEANGAGIPGIGTRLCGVEGEAGNDCC